MRSAGSHSSWVNGSTFSRARTRGARIHELEEKAMKGKHVVTNLAEVQRRATIDSALLRWVQAEIGHEGFSQLVRESDDPVLAAAQVKVFR